MRAGIFKTTIQKIIEFGTDTRHFRVAFEPNTEFDFKAGQFASFLVEKTDEDRVIKRPYSIASPPNWKGTLDFIWKRVEGGFVTNYLWDLDEGDELTIQAPLGIFTIKEPLPKTIIFISTGTGIAPFRSMIHYLIDQKADCELINIFGTRYDDSILYQDEFETLESENKNFKNHFTVSRPKTWTGETEYVQEVLKKNISNPDDKHIYICGLTKMIDAVVEMAVSMGFQKDQIFFEKYD